MLQHLKDVLSIVGGKSDPITSCTYLHSQIDLPESMSIVAVQLLVSSILPSNRPGFLILTKPHSCLSESLTMLTCSTTKPSCSN